MSDMVIDKLIQKASNVLEEIAEVNIKINQLSPPSELLNSINGRLDAINLRLDAIDAALKKIESRVMLDEKKVEELQKQTEKITKTVDSAISRLAGTIDLLRTEETKNWGENDQRWGNWALLKFRTAMGWCIQVVLLAIILICIALR